MKTTLYKNHQGSIGVWSIWDEGAVIHIMYRRTLTGKDTRKTEVVEGGKQNRTLAEQVQSRMESRINKQLDKGYVRTMEEAKKAPTNQLDLKQPMLAQPAAKVKVIQDGAFIQPKLDGHRCLITNRDGEIIAYTRQGKMIDSIDHITSELRGVLEEGHTVDGELYRHNTALQTISSLIKRKQADTETLTFNMYDAIMDEPFAKRLSFIDQFRGVKNVNVVETLNLDETEGVQHMLNKYIEDGYEGAIIRHSALGYQAGRRSQSLVKVKKFHDSEFTVIDITRSADGWGVLHCRTGNGDVFRVSAPGTIGEKTMILADKEKYIGREVTVEYSALTNGGIPFHPVALRFREDI